MVYTVEPCGFARCYVIAGREGLMVVDVGSLGAARAAAELIRRQLGMSPADIRYLAATHFHIDHIGGMKTLLKACPPQTKIIFHRLVKDYLTGQRQLPPLAGWVTALPPVTWAAAGYIRRPADAVVEGLAGIPLPFINRMSSLSFHPDRCDFVEAGQGPPGFEDWKIMATPGHTEDSLSFYHRESAALICGDLLHNVKKDGRGELNAFCGDKNLIRATLDRLRRTIAPRAIYPGHGEIIQDEGNALLNVKTDEFVSHDGDDEVKSSRGKACES